VNVSYNSLGNLGGTLIKPYNFSQPTPPLASCISSGMVLSLIFATATYAQSPIINCDTRNDINVPEACHGYSYISALDELLEQVYIDAGADVTWLSIQELNDFASYGRDALNQCGSNSRCQEEVYHEQINTLSVNTISIDAQLRYRGFIYIGEPRNGSCPEGAELSDNDACVQYFGAGPYISAITHKNQIAAEMTYVAAGNAHLCRFTGTGNWTGDAWKLLDTGTPACELSIQMNGSEIQVTQNDLCNELCGMRAKNGLSQTFGFVD